ncbi:MAG TPA: ribosomal protein S18-alanine N-acetyltransferase [Candidatus Krumholzibacteria bacterium]|nr:ribosomal protein S18-alanine N-acetyltransferase [Candidatus Krumholzibacteria bacterium]
MSDLVIDQLELMHIPDVLRIERELFPAPWTEGMFLQEIEEKWLSRSFVGTVDKVVAGYIVAWLLRDEVHILNLAIGRAFQRRGYARRLLVHMIDIAKSEKSRLITLEVRVSNTPAKLLYHTMGFAPVGIRRRYYHDNNEDALVMTLRLEQP